VASDGWLTLEGSVEWNYQVNYQRERAEEAVRYLRGVKEAYPVDSGRHYI